MKLTVKLCLSLACVTLAHAQTCSDTMPYSNMQYLTPAQLTLYGLTDPCTVTCNTGFFGDFCTPIPTPPPVGPWNQAGYYTAGQGIVRGLTLSTGQLYQAQVAGDSMAGISNILYSDARLVLISLSTRTVTPILSAPAPGSLTAMVMRGGVVYVAREFTSSTPGYDVVGIAPAVGASPQRLFNISGRAAHLEVFMDKGTVTVFIATYQNTVAACYPTKCVQLKSGVSGVTGLFCGPECPHSFYYTRSTSLYRLSGVQGTVSEGTVVSDTSNILCVGGDRSLNVLLFASEAGLRQVNLITNQILSPAPGVTGRQFCSLDISDSNSQIVLTQASAITSINAYQQLCGYGRTSPAVYSSAASCVACPAPPDNAFLVLGSAVCEWQCRAGYTQYGSLCTLPVVQPCPDFFRPSGRQCVPGVQPWAPAGAYAASVSQGQGSWTAYLNPYLLASNGTGLFLVAPGHFLYAPSTTYSFSPLNVVPKAGDTCSASTSNSYNLLVAQGQSLLAAFSLTVFGRSTHCLWALEARPTSVTQLQSWSLASQICAAASQDLATVYVIFCGSHYISQLSRASVASPLAGRSKRGYADGPLLSSAFNGPSSLVLYQSRLYVADTGNCLLREVDLARGAVSTVAGSGACVRSDLGGLAYPSNLTYSAYPGFFLFLDQYPSEAFPTLRQFHAPTGTLSTVAATSVRRDWLTYVVGLRDRLLVGQSRTYYQITPVTLPCRAGSTSAAGGAFGDEECVACLSGYYSGPGGCVACSSPACTGPGQLFIPCQASRDAYCSLCTNKPGGTDYTGPSTVPGNATGGGGDCPWAYLPPCPVGYYKSGALCAACPMWSTTNLVGAASLSQCVCLAGGAGGSGVCTIPSPFAQPPAVCGPLAACPAYQEPAFPFTLLDSCLYLVTDSPDQVCACGPGEYIQQIHPKVCARCPQGLYSPRGRGCRNCPSFTEPTQDQAGCRCAAGALDAAPAAADPQCVCGPGTRLSGGCAPCPANTYSADAVPVGAGSSVCAACEAGTSAPAGSAACEPCGLGRYREAGGAACEACAPGLYAPDPASAVCVACAADCGGQREAPCPTDPAMVMCSPCGPARANAAFNGGLDCATDCLPGFYESDGECVPCTGYSRSTCGAGQRHVPCARYSDAACVPCVNSSKPLNFAEWAYTPALPGGPSARCAWRCADGYTPQAPALPGVVDAWQCVREGDWTVWDLFTL